MNMDPHQYPTILSAFDHQVECMEDSIAVRCGKVSLTYREVNAYANAAALYLEENSIEAGDAILISMPPCEWMPIAVLAVMKLGAIYVPVGDSYPEAWKQNIIEKSDVKAVIAVSSHECAAFFNGPICDMTALKPAEQAVSTTINPESAGAVIFTSGSTGEPKGVVLKHKGMANLCAWLCGFVDLTTEDHFAMYQNFAFVSHIEPMFTPFFAGACTDIIPDDIRLNMTDLNAYYMDHSITVSKMGTSAGRHFLSSVAKTSLRVLILSGEKFGKVPSVEGVRVIDAYGPTENTAQITAIYTDEKTEPADIGKPIDNTTIYVLDDKKQKVKVGETGRLFVSGFGVAAGYLNAPELTAQSFVANPFVIGKDDAVMYDTGDIVRLLENGSIAFVGRKDDQIKIHGCRVELAEISTVIETLPEVARCVCIGIPTDDGLDQRIAAYVEFKKDIAARKSFLQTLVKQKVASTKPKYMIPTFVVPMDGFPLNRNGKVDKKQLPKPEIAIEQKPYVAPTTEKEKAVCQQFETLFGLEQVGIDDDFIDLGGDSLHAMFLLSNLQDFNITAADVLQRRTPRGIAACAEHMDLDYMQDYPYTYETGFPFSTFQVVVYNEIHSREEKDNELMPVEIDIPVNFSCDAIMAAMDHIFDTHPILSAYVDDSSDVIFNRIGSKPLIPYYDIDTREVLKRFRTQTFDYRKSLSRYMLVKNKQGHRLYCQFHHSIADVTSLTVFIKHFWRALNGEKLELDTGMLRQGAFEAGLNNSPLYVEAANFFDEMLKPLAECKPLVSEYGAEKPGNLLKYYDLNRQKLADFTQKHHTSLGAFYTAAFGLCCSLYSKGNCAVFLTAENDRDRLHLRDAFGAFTKLVPILIDCRFDKTDVFMEHATKTFLDLCNYDYYSLTQLYMDYPLTNSIYQDFLSYDLSAVKLGDTPDYQDSYIILDGENEIAQTDFYCNIMETARGFAVFVEHSEKFDEAYVTAFCDSLYKIVNQLINGEGINQILKK